MQGRRRTGHRREARAERAAPPASRTNDLAIAEDLVRHTVPHRTSRCLRTGRSGGVVMMLLVLRRPPRLPNRRANSPARGSANGDGGTSNVVRVLLGPEPLLLSLES